MPVWVRYVLVPGYNDSDSEIEAFIDTVRPLRNVERVEVLAFHKLGQEKYADLGLRFSLADAPTPSREQLNAVKQTMRDQGLVVS